MKRTPKIAIVGAGITGLSLGYFLKERFGSKMDLTLFEKQTRVGGWIQTHKEDPFLFELGPRGIRPSGKGVHTVELIQSLGLCDQVIEAKAKRRYLLEGGKLVSPLSFGLIPSFLKDLFAARGGNEDESIHSFFCRRFGSTFAEEKIDPLVSGVFAGDSKTLSLKACFPYFAELETNYRSLILGSLFHKKMKTAYTSSLISFKNGMETLPKKLGEILEPNLIFEKTLSQIRCEKGSVVLTFEAEQKEFDTVFLTLPSNVLQKLGVGVHIPLASVTVVNVGFKKQVLKEEGFGYLVAKKQKEPILGVVFDSEVFPEQNGSSPQTQTRLTVMTSQEVGAKEAALEACSRHLGISDCPDFLKETRANQAISQYPVGYLSQVAGLKRDIKNRFPGVWILGSGVDGVAVNDCIAIAKKVSCYLYSN
jgi:oxygen-dependent protoporphyrinogen oxidase